jgi:redox-sensing transcriptional repressor
MKRAKISNNVIRRLPRYLRKLNELAFHGVDHISSGELGKQMSLTPSQIRQDFSCFGEFGQQGYGYSVETLRSELSTILGMKRSYSVILIGIGNLGHALIKNFGFDRYGFRLLAGFDVDEAIIGTEFSGVPIHHANTLQNFLQENPVDIAVLAVPGNIANSVATMISDCGVKGIWNFTNIELAIEKPDVLVENIHFSDSLLVLSYFLSNSTAKLEDEPEF